MKTFVVPLALCALLPLAVPLRAQTPPTPEVVIVPKGAQEVWKLDQARRTAMVKEDFDTLSRLLADDLTYIHANGKADNKESLLKTLRSRATVYESVSYFDPSVRAYGDSVVVTGVTEIAVRVGGAPVRFRARFTAVWAKVGRQWKFAAWQTTRLQEP